jgi:DNA polymerase III subunit alpha
MPNKIPRFVHLHLHTEYSLLDGACSLKPKVKGTPPPLMAHLHTLGMDSVAMTDHGNMFGVVDFYQQCIKAGVKPIIGVEGYIAEKDHKTKGLQAGTKQRSAHLVLLAKDMTGYLNLLKLVSISYLDGFYYKPRMDKNLLREHSEGLICLSACLAGEIATKVVQDHVDEARDAAQEYLEIFGEGNYYLEVQHNGLEDQVKANKGIIEIAKELSIPLVATNDCHYISQDDSEMQDVLMCVQTNRKITDPGRMSMSTNEFYVKSPEIMDKNLGHLPGAIENTVAIAERCNLELDFSGTVFHLPHYDIPADQPQDPGDYLRQLVMEGTEKRYPTPLSEEIKDRIDFELSIIDKMGYQAYFLIVWDFINYARSQGIAVGPGRGSAAGSIVSYCTGITNIDPLEYGLLFERFLNPERISMPDIDIDFDDRRREEVIRYCSEKYGKNSVAQIATMGRIKAKNAIRDVGRVLEIPLPEVNRVAKLIPDGPKVRLGECLDEVPELRAIANSNSQYRFWFEQAKNVEGMIRQWGVHAAGVVITKGDLRKHVPLIQTNKGEVAAQFTMEGIECLGLLKMDFLGLSTLSVIDRAVQMLKKRGIEIDLESMVFDDKKTYDLICSGRTDGIFQVESSGMKNLLLKLLPRHFEEIIALMALYRPGPLGSGMVESFVNCKHGREEMQFDHPILEPILKETYGVILYQEQVMKIAVEMAGFSMGEADLMRRAMGKKKEDVMKALKDKFVKGAIERQIPNLVAAKTFENIEYFAGYGFNKSHSAAYAVLTYQTAFLKANYPREFMAGLLTNEMGNTEKMVKYIRDCRDLGIEVLAPDINKSETDFSVHDEAVRYGLGGIKGVGTAATEIIIQERDKNGAFHSLEDFCERIEANVINSKTVECLIRCGAFDGFVPNRAQLLRLYPQVMEHAASKHRDMAIGQLALFGDAENPEDDALPLPQIPDLPENEQLANERDLLGIYVSGHPLDQHKRDLKVLANANLDKLDQRSSLRGLRLGGVVSEVIRRTTREGEHMVTFTLEDSFGTIECRAFGDAARESDAALIDGQVVIVEGDGDRRDDRPSMRVWQIVTVDQAPDKFIAAVHLNVESDTLADNRISALKQAFIRMRGGADLFFHVNTSKGKEVVIRTGDDFKISPSGSTLQQMEEILSVPSEAFSFEYAKTKPKPANGRNFRRRE